VNETKKAVKEVGKASQSYMGAIAHSGIGRAGYMIGSAVAKTANRSALVVAEYAVEASGTSENRLPTPLRNWVKGKKTADEAKRRAQMRVQEAKDARRLEALKADLMAGGRIMDTPLGSLPSNPSAAGTQCNLPKANALQDIPSNKERHRKAGGPVKSMSVDGVSLGHRKSHETSNAITINRPRRESAAAKMSTSIGNSPGWGSPFDTTHPFHVGDSPYSDNHNSFKGYFATYNQERSSRQHRSDPCGSRVAPPQASGSGTQSEVVEGFEEVLVEYEGEDLDAEKNVRDN
jgi:hypothetical protein